jgi:hypothetical protein
LGAAKRGRAFAAAGFIEDRDALGFFAAFLPTTGLVFRAGMLSPPWIEPAREPKGLDKDAPREREAQADPGTAKRRAVFGFAGYESRRSRGLDDGSFLGVTKISIPCSWPADT